MHSLIYTKVWCLQERTSQPNKKYKYEIMYRGTDSLLSFLYLLLVIFDSKDESLYFLGFGSHFAQFPVLRPLACHEFTPKVIDCTKCAWFLRAPGTKFVVKQRDFKTRAESFEAHPLVIVGPHATLPVRIFQ